MTVLMARHMNAIESTEQISGRSHAAPRSVLLELQQHNERLSQIINELLIKNQALRSELQRIGAMEVIERTFALPDEAA